METSSKTDAQRLEHDLVQIKADCALLVLGWNDKVEYKVPVAYHRITCKYRQRLSTGCQCPVTNETRIRNVKRPGLLEQLEKFKEYQDTDREPKAERQAPRVKKIKNNAELGGFFTLDEIACDVSATIDRLWSEAEKPRTWAVIGTKNLLGALPGQAAMLSSRPDLVHELARAVAGWVRLAGRTLRLIVSDSIFGDSCCGNCGGGLVVPVDASGDVRCVGKPGGGPCGETYPMSEWVGMYERRQR